MGPEASHHECEQWRVLLTRTACDGGEPCSELSAHVAICDRCRQELSQARRLVADLCEALRPEPGSAALIARVAAGLDRAAKASVDSRRWLWVAGLAAAALVAVTLPPWWLISRLGGLPDPVRTELSSDDAAAVARALATLTWDSAADYCADGLSQRIAELSRLISGRTVDQGGCLPWAAEDDWDRAPPRSERGGQIPSGWFGTDEVVAQVLNRKERTI